MSSFCCLGMQLIPGKAVQRAAGGTTATGLICSGKKSPQEKLHLGEPHLSTHYKMPAPRGVRVGTVL